jgi:hypothetical protein
LRTSTKSILTRARTFQQASHITTHPTLKAMLKSIFIEKTIGSTTSLCSNNSNSTKTTHKISPTTNSSDVSSTNHAKSSNIQIRSTKNRSHQKTSKLSTSISPNSIHTTQKNQQTNAQTIPSPLTKKHPLYWRMPRITL